jgi:hypothetical protein
LNLEPLTSRDLRQAAWYRLQARLGAGGMGQVYLTFATARLNQAR